MFGFNVKLVPLIFYAAFCIGVQAVKCPGKCTSNLTGCKAKGGSIIGYCTTSLACCDTTRKQVGSCKDKKSGVEPAIFQSPHYPKPTKGTLSCSFDFEIPEGEFAGVYIEFVDVFMDGAGFAAHSYCEGDMILIQGLAHWIPPARCGNLTGYSTIIERAAFTKGKEKKTISILAIMSSPLYKWKIRLTVLKVKKAADDSNEENEGIDEEKNPGIDEVPFSLNAIGMMTTGDNFGTSDINRRRVVTLSNAEIDKEIFTSLGEVSWEDDVEFYNIEDPLIVNGEDTMIASYPWQASLRIVVPEFKLKRANISNDYNKSGPNCTSDGRHFCGGSIISDQHILSAAHCIYGITKLNGMVPLDHIRIYLGDTDLCSDDQEKYGQPSQVYSAQNVIFHYGYDDDAFINDVVVIKLKEKINFTSYIQPIKLAKKGMTFDGQMANASGWGMTNLTTMPMLRTDILQSADGIQIESKKKCELFLKRQFGTSRERIETYPKYKGMFDSIICTKPSTNVETKLVGQGDSGGPLVVTMAESDTPLQVGIVSYGLQALQKKSEHENAFIDFFQDVAFYRDWIELARGL